MKMCLEFTSALLKAKVFLACFALTLCWHNSANAASVNADHIDTDALVTELSRNSEVCVATFKQDRNKLARNCATACASAARSVKSLVARGGYTSGDLKRFQEHCLDAVSEAGIPKAELVAGEQKEQTIVVAPSLQERLAALPEKNNFCKQHYDALNCQKVLFSRTAPELVQTCNIYSRCNCGPMQIPERISQYQEQTRPYNMATGQLDQCERNYLKAKKLH